MGWPRREHGGKEQDDVGPARQPELRGDHPSEDQGEGKDTRTVSSADGLDCYPETVPSAPYRTHCLGQAWGRIRKGFLMGRGASSGQTRGWEVWREEGTGAAGVGCTVSASLRHVHPSRPVFEGVPGAQPNFQGCSGTVGMVVRETVWGWNSFPEAVKPPGLGDSGPGPSPAPPLVSHVTSATSQTPPPRTAVRTR